jgi:hypothetical protein
MLIAFTGEIMRVAEQVPCVCSAIRFVCARVPQARRA